MANKAWHMYDGRPLKDVCSEMGINFRQIRLIARSKKISNEEAVNLYLYKKENDIKEFKYMYDEKTPLKHKCKEFGLVYQSVRVACSKNPNTPVKEIFDIFLRQKELKDKE